MNTTSCYSPVACGLWRSPVRRCWGGAGQGVTLRVQWGFGSSRPASETRFDGLLPTVPMPLPDTASASSLNIAGHITNACKDKSQV